MTTMFFKKNIFYVLAIIATTQLSCKSYSVKKAVPSANKFDFHNTPEVYADSMPDSLKYLIPIFDTILCDDQKFREKLNSDLLLQNAKEQDKLDSINIIKVEAIINKYGILGKKKFGIKGITAVTSVLQHSKLKIKEKYLPMVKEAFINKYITGDFYAMFSDRISTYKFQLQKYGTQLKVYKNVYTLYPVINIDSINIWRKEMGQISIEDYFKIFKTTFNREEYKKQLPELIKFYGVKEN